MFRYVPVSSLNERQLRFSPAVPRMHVTLLRGFRMKITCRKVDWQFIKPFRIAYRTRTRAETIVVEVQDQGLVGRGEALGVSYRGETGDSLLREVESVTQQLSAGISRADLQELLPAGGARNAIDCALWDLEAKRSGCRAWEIAGFHDVRPLITSYTLALDSPEATGKAAASAQQYSQLKLKLSGEGDLERVARVREARPDARLLVDANQSWNEQQLRDLLPSLIDMHVRLIEQPLPATGDDELRHVHSPIPLCADESCQTSECLPAVVGKYQYVNIKLDKAGGLTEALRLARAAIQAGLKPMIGCMGGSSLSMAPAFIVGQLCEVADLDGPLLITEDMHHGIRYQGSLMHPPSVALWG
jgi:L-Ala-D/L-Glu epimerase